MEKKNSFVLYTDYRSQFDLLTDAELGQLIRAVMDYVETGQPPDLPAGPQMAFSFLQVDADKQLKASRCGKNHWNWKGGVSTENHRIRTSAAYRNWRTEVLSRDKYICQRCGKEGGKLNVHHIKSFCANKELRTSIDNGITLCEECHREVHKHAR